MPKKRSGGGLTGTQQAAKFLGVSVLSGAVLAGIALPAFGALGLAAKGTVKGFDEIPANLKTPPLSQRTTILDSKGGLIATVYSRDRTVVPLKDISPHMQKAIVAIEDSRFYEHGAIDLKGVLRALNKNATSGEVAQGASTLTQQYVKNVFVEEAGDDAEKFAEATQQTLGRKIQELKYAIQLEEELGKKTILENYLNITFFGQKSYGVEAASQRYFSKPAKDLNLEQAALLAGLVQSPSRYDPVNDAEEATKRRNIVLQRMAEVGDISPEEAARAKATPIKLNVSEPKNGCITAVNGAGFFCDYVRKSFLSDPVFGKTRDDRRKVWDRGGLTIKTTLDPQAQKSTQKSIKKHVYKSDKVATAVTIVQPGTGKILAMGQSRPYGYGKNETEINYSVDKKLGGSNYGFPVGSTFKPFVAAAALEQGRPPTQVYPAPYQMPYPDSIPTCDGGTWRNSAKRSPGEREREGGGAVRAEEGDGDVGQHLLRPDDRGHRALPGRRDDRQAEGDPGQRRQTAGRSLRADAGLDGDLAADDGQCVRDVRQSGHVLQPDRHRVDPHGGRPKPQGAEEHLREGDERADRGHHQHPAGRRDRLRHRSAGGSVEPRQRGQDGYDGRAPQRLVRRLHAEPVRGRLGG